MLRKRKEKSDFTGDKITEVIDRGERVPTPVIFKIWMDKLEQFKHQDLKGFVIDGSPRTVMEAKMLDKALDWYGWEERRVIFIDVSEEESLTACFTEEFVGIAVRFIPILRSTRIWKNAKSVEENW